jgi:hypothetical protein
MQRGGVGATTPAWLEGLRPLSLALVLCLSPIVLTATGATFFAGEAPNPPLWGGNGGSATPS